jgi:hypothetical protein
MQMLPNTCEHGSIYASSVSPSRRSSPILSLQMEHLCATGNSFVWDSEEQSGLGLCTDANAALSLSMLQKGTRTYLSHNAKRDKKSSLNKNAVVQLVRMGLHTVKSVCNQE